MIVFPTLNRHCFIFSTATEQTQTLQETNSWSQEKTAGPSTEPFVSTVVATTEPSNTDWEDLPTPDRLPDFSPAFSVEPRPWTVTEEGGLPRDSPESSLRLGDATGSASSTALGVPVRTDSTYFSTTVSRAGERTLLSVTLSTSGNSTSSVFTEDTNSRQPPSTWGVPVRGTESEDYTNSVPSTSANDRDTTRSDPHLTHSFSRTFSETESPGMSRGTHALTGRPNSTEDQPASTSEGTPNSTPPLRVTGTSTDQSDMSVSSTPPGVSPDGRPANVSGTVQGSGSSVGTSTESSTGSLSSSSSGTQGGTERVSSQTEEVDVGAGLTTALPTVRTSITELDDSLTRFLSGQPPFIPKTDGPVSSTEVFLTTTPVTVAHSQVYFWNNFTRVTSYLSEEKIVPIILSQSGEVSKRGFCPKHWFKFVFFPVKCISKVSHSPFLYFALFSKNPGNPCAPNPCMNGGMCVSHEGREFTCRCLQAWTGLNCSEDANECEQDPCPPGSRCVNTQGSFSCKCPLGFDLHDGRTCTRAKTFLGTFSVNRQPHDLVEFRRVIVHEIQREIIQLLNASLSVLHGYSRSTLSNSEEEDGLHISAVNMFSVSTEVTSAEVFNSIQMSLSNCSSSSAHCRMVLHHKLTYQVESLCLAQKTPCDTERSTCTDSSGTAYCQCLQGYYKHNPEDLSCIGEPPLSVCVCMFGFGGFNCGNFYKLIAVVVSPAGGGLLLILIIALIVTCCRKDKNDINKIIFKSGDLQMSPYTDFPKSSRVSMEWGRETIEMQENGSTKNLLQMTDIYYSPALRNSDLERNGLYPFTGLPGSRHSCIYPAQWNPSFISDDSRRRDYF
uniref:Heart development protein with EGF-like domains 1 n=1 Tax=Myripristis murdjan TaxID=586833 RepID=A0A668AUU1_9TELE